MLRPARDHEWKPMGWDYSVKKSNDKSCDKDGYKNNVIHFGEVWFTYNKFYTATRDLNIR
jgi:hypothetical protein